LSQPPRHTITRQVIAACAPDEALARQARGALDEINITQFTPAITRVLEEFEQPGIDIFLDDIELDLGGMRIDQLADEGVARLEAALRQALSDRLRPVTGPVTRPVTGPVTRPVTGRMSPQNVTRRTLLQSDLEAVSVYLVTGRLPPWYWPGGSFDVNRMLEHLATKDAPGLGGLLRQIGTSGRVIERLVLQSNPQTLAHMVIVLARPHAGLILDTVSELREATEFGSTTASGSVEFDAELWTLTLRSLITEPGGRFNQLDFVRGLLDGVAPRVRSDYTRLLQRVSRGLGQRRRTRRKTEALAAIVQQLSKEALRKAPMRSDANSLAAQSEESGRDVGPDGQTNSAAVHGTPESDGEAHGNSGSLSAQGAAVPGKNGEADNSACSVAARGRPESNINTDGTTGSLPAQVAVHDINGETGRNGETDKSTNSNAAPRWVPARDSSADGQINSVAAQRSAESDGEVDGSGISLPVPGTMPDRNGEADRSAHSVAARQTRNSDDAADGNTNSLSAQQPVPDSNAEPDGQTNFVAGQRTPETNIIADGNKNSRLGHGKEHNASGDADRSAHSIAAPEMLPGSDSEADGKTNALSVQRARSDWRDEAVFADLLTVADGGAGAVDAAAGYSSEIAEWLLSLDDKRLGRVLAQALRHLSKATLERALAALPKAGLAVLTRRAERIWVPRRDVATGSANRSRGRLTRQELARRVVAAVQGGGPKALLSADLTPPASEEVAVPLHEDTIATTAGRAKAVPTGKNMMPPVVPHTAAPTTDHTAPLIDGNGENFEADLLQTLWRLDITSLMQLPAGKIRHLLTRAAAQAPEGVEDWLHHAPDAQLETLLALLAPHRLARCDDLRRRLSLPPGSVATLHATALMAAVHNDSGAARIGLRQAVDGQSRLPGWMAVIAQQPPGMALTILRFVAHEIGGQSLRHDLTFAGADWLRGLWRALAGGTAAAVPGREGTGNLIDAILARVAEGSEQHSGPPDIAMPVAPRVLEFADLVALLEAPDTAVPGMIIRLRALAGPHEMRMLVRRLSPQKRARLITRFLLAMPTRAVPSRRFGARLVALLNKAPDVAADILAFMLYSETPQIPDWSPELRDLVAEVLPDLANKVRAFEKGAQGAHKSGHDAEPRREAALAFLRRGVFNESFWHELTESRSDRAKIEDGGDGVAQSGSEAVVGAGFSRGGAVPSGSGDGSETGVTMAVDTDQVAGLAGRNADYGPDDDASLGGGPFNMEPRPDPNAPSTQGTRHVSARQMPGRKGSSEGVPVTDRALATATLAQSAQMVSVPRHAVDAAVRALIADSPDLARQAAMTGALLAPVRGAMIGSLGPDTLARLIGLLLSRDGGKNLDENATHRRVTNMVADLGKRHARRYLWQALFEMAGRAEGALDLETARVALWARMRRDAPKLAYLTPQALHRDRTVLSRDTGSGVDLHRLRTTLMADSPAARRAARTALTWLLSKPGGANGLGKTLSAAQVRRAAELVDPVRARLAVRILGVATTAFPGVSARMHLQTQLLAFIWLKRTSPWSAKSFLNRLILGVTGGDSLGVQMTNFEALARMVAAARQSGDDDLVRVLGALVLPTQEARVRDQLGGEEMRKSARHAASDPTQRHAHNTTRESGEELTTSRETASTPDNPGTPARSLSDGDPTTFQAGSAGAPTDQVEADPTGNPALMLPKFAQPAPREAGGAFAAESDTVGHPPQAPARPLPQGQADTAHDNQRGTQLIQSETDGLVKMEQTRTATTPAGNTSHDDATPQIFHTSDDGDIYLDNAGLVLATPFLPHLFSQLEFLAKDPRDRTCIDPGHLSRAVHLLQFLVTGKTRTPEPFLTLNKVLCGVSPSVPVTSNIAPTEAEIKLCEALLQAMLANWPPLADGTSIAGLRETFLQREGRLRRNDTGWELSVERKTLDVLLDQTNWGFRTVMNPWMPEVLHVDW
jgi:hypothetical protein